MISYEEQTGTGIVGLSRPEKRNALSREMLERLAELFTSFSDREDLRAIILMGEGGTFSAGTDIAELAELDETEARAAAERGQNVCALIEACPVPVIAAISGTVAGGGCEVAFAAHLRVASSDARFSLPELKLGLIPAYGGTQRLARAAGAQRAFAMMLAGEIITAEEALRAGLINRVVLTPEEALREAMRLAQEITQQAPLAVRAALYSVTRGVEMPLDEGLALEAELFSRLFATEDMREGTRAFLEKRPPVFTGQ